MPLKPINTQSRIKEKSIKINNIDLQENSLSGDLIQGGTISQFASTGIKDSASELKIEITDQQTSIFNDVFIRGTINCQTLRYNRAEVPKINTTQAVMIDNNEVLWKDRLGKSVRISSLEKVAVLKDLEVANTLFDAEGRVGINTRSPSADFSVLSNGHEIITRHTGESGFVGSVTHTPFSIGTDNTPRLIVKSNGDITVDGNIGIGVRNPKEKLEVAGNIKFQDKIFSSGTQEPTNGTWTTGSVVWNDQPKKGLYVGWVCIKGGTPGSWRPFGLIS